MHFASEVACSQV